MNKVYIVLVNFNNYVDTIECMDSILKSNYQDYQVVVCDNCSTNDSYTKLNEYINKNSIQKKVKLLKNSKNLGFGAGNNFGLKYVFAQKDAEYIWFLNNDTVIDPNALKEQLKTISRDPKIGLVGSKILDYYHRDTIQALGGVDAVTVFGKGHHLGYGLKDREMFGKDQETTGYIYGASLFVKREVLEDIGTFNEDYFMLLEEVDLCLRAKQNGWKLYFCAKSKVWHKDGASSGNKLEKKFLFIKTKRVSLESFKITGYYYLRNRILLLRDHFKNLYLLGLVFVLIEMLRMSIAVVLFDDNKRARIGLLYRGLYAGVQNKRRISLK